MMTHLYLETIWKYWNYFHIGKYFTTKKIKLDQDHQHKTLFKN